MMDMAQYLDVFLEESKEHLGSLNERLLKLEKNSGDIDSLNEIFRAAHTLKGMSSTMGFEDVANLTHHMEDVLADLKEGILKADPKVIDILFKCFDRLQLMIDNIETGQSEKMDNSDLLSILKSIKSGNYEAAAMLEPAVEPVPAADPVDDQKGFALNNYDMTVLQEAASKGFNIVYMKVAISPGCLMKAVRAFMVFKALEEDGEIIKSEPPAQELDEGKFDSDFEIFMVTKTNAETLKGRVNNISEVSVAALQEVNIDSLNVAQPVLQPVQDDQNITPSNGESNNKKIHKVKQTVRVDIDKLDNLMNLVGELVMHKGRLEQIGTGQKLPALHETIEQIDRVTTDLQSVVMKVRMVPIEQVFNRFPRMVRDLAKELNKEIDFIIEGKETELDRTVIDEIGDPLVHLLRNAVDHGIESPEKRKAVGKSPVGIVTLRARHEGNNVFIEVEDDGEGIDVDRVKSRAVEKEFISAREAEQMGRDEAIDLLFKSGFSTSTNVTDVSGRGVGLDVVKTKIESLNGEIFISSKPGEGTRFIIKLPLTLAIIQALMVSIGSEIYAIPLSSVDETTMITGADIKMVQNQEVIVLRGSVLPLFRLATLLEVPDHVSNEEEMYVVVVRRADKQIGLVVDTLIGQQEIVIKSLGKVLGNIPGIAGAIVGGDGNVRLILDITTLY
ncbi:MAG: chemotaxis protein CheW [Syntrophomonadaceae bacterium]|jgi:two-component system chemotaxis sensor kinase CheA